MRINIRQCGKAGSRSVFFLVLISTILALVGLELGLRAAGWLIQRQQLVANPHVNFGDPREFRIVALGESTTAQYWSAGREASWPGQLEAKLNKAGLGRNFKVINLGVGGITSPFLVADLEKKIEILRPNAVISMMGINDGTSTEFVAPPLQQLRLVKFYHWLSASLRARSFVPAKTIPIERQGAIDHFFETQMQGAATATVNEVDHWRNVADAFSRQQGGDQWYADQKAASFFESLIQTGGHEINTLQRHWARVAFEFAQEASVRNPGSLEVAYWVAFAGAIAKTKREMLVLIHGSLRAGLVPNGKLFSLLEWAGAGDDPEVRAAMEAQGFRENKGKSPYQTTSDSYRRLAELCREHGIFYLAMQYPTLDIGAVRNFFAKEPDLNFPTFRTSIRHDFGKQEIAPEYQSVVFVGNDNFNEVVTPQNFKTYFSDIITEGPNGNFGHTTTKGHALIAENAASAIIKNWGAISGFGFH